MAARILVIDDDEGVLHSCRTILEDQGHEVETASGGKDGLALLRQHSFDLALIDLKMPKMNGLEVLERAAALDPDLVSIIFTAFGTIDSAVDAVKKGAFNYVTKPFTAGQLAAVALGGGIHSAYGLVPALPHPHDTRAGPHIPRLPRPPRDPHPHRFRGVSDRQPRGGYPGDIGFSLEENQQPVGH